MIYVKTRIYNDYVYASEGGKININYVGYEGPFRDRIDAEEWIKYNVAAGDTVEVLELG